MYRYETVAAHIREWISSGLIRPGDRLLSVRELSSKLRYSTVTVHQALTALQDEGILYSEPRSGFFVSATARRLPEFAPDSDFEPSTTTASNAAAFNAGRLSLEADEAFSVASVSEDLTPSAELYRLMATNLRWEGARGETVPQFGISTLREAVAKRVIDRAPSRRIRDIVITANKRQALETCLDILLPRSGKILVETPTDARIVQSLLNRNVEIVEIYSHPKLGLDPDQFEHLTKVNDIALCILSLTNHIPTGISYSEDVTRLISKVTTERDIPIIEDLPSQGISHSESAMGLTEFDTKGLVFRIGSFSDTLGERFGLGWIAVPERYHSSIRQAPVQNIAGDWARQKAVADFLSRRSYDKHIKSTKEMISTRLHKGISLLSRAFPESCTVSRPSSGYMCWVRGPKEFNAYSLVRDKSLVDFFAPGPLFSCTRAFGNFFALNLSHPWSSDREEELWRLGQILAELPERPGTTNM